MFNRQTALSSSSRLSRRDVLKSASTGFGYLALSGLLGQSQARSEDRATSPLAPKPPHLAAKAKRVIFLFMQGATSQMDTWEYKPQLQKDDGKVGPGGGTLTGSKFKFKQYGQRSEERRVGKECVP